MNSIATSSIHCIEEVAILEFYFQNLRSVIDRLILNGINVAGNLTVQGI